MCIEATFENHWDLLLFECANRRESNTCIPLKLLFKRILSTNKASVTT